MISDESPAMNRSHFHFDSPVTSDVDLSPLVESLANGTGVVYVGAGASVAAGLASWQSFMERCVDLACRSIPEDARNKWRLTRQRIAEGDYLTAAELLQRELGSRLEQYIWDSFGSAESPSPIHRAVARLPFSLAVTTNYDRLLESSYRSRPNVWTWRDAAALFSALRHSRFAVVKSHGDVGNGPSLVLSKTQYRDLIHLNASFNECLKMLLSLRTFLFVGTSLRDPDLLGMLDSVRLVLGEGFGPHFAIFFDDSADAAFVSHLRVSYGIHSVVLPAPKAANAPQLRTAAAVSVLRDLSGQVSLLQQSRMALIHVDDPLFNLRAASQELLRQTLAITGSDRGSICLQKSDQRRVAYEVAEESFRSQGEMAWGEERTVGSSTILGRLYLGSAGEHDFVYLPNVSRAREALEGSALHGAAYEMRHSDVRSELACPVFSDGQRVGVINVESVVENAYSRAHLLTLQSLADKAGWLYFETMRRTALANSLLPYFDDPDSFSALMNRCRFLGPRSFTYVLFRIDYRAGALVARLPAFAGSEVSTDKGEYRIRFEDSSLATKVFKTRGAIFEKDVEECFSKPDCPISREVHEKFRAKGPIYAAPIEVDRNTAAVLVCWSDVLRERPLTSTRASTLQRRIDRMAHLVANSPDDIRRSDGKFESRASSFVSMNNANMVAVDENLPWTKEKLLNSQFRADILLALMKSLVDPICGWTRVRIWVRINASGKGRRRFRLAHSLTSPDATIPGKVQRNAYVGVEAGEDSVYCGYTLARGAHDSQAHYLHRSMFDVPDVNCELLDKPHDLEWIVAPIRRNKKVIAFISADRFRRDDGNARGSVHDFPSQRQREFQRACLDLLAEIATTVVEFEERQIPLGL